MTGASEQSGEIEAFFARYAEAFAARDAQALAQCFLFPCHIVGDDGEITLTVMTSVDLYLAEIIKPLFKGYRRLVGYLKSCLKLGIAWSTTFFITNLQLDRERERLLARLGIRQNENILRPSEWALVFKEPFTAIFLERRLSFRHRPKRLQAGEGFVSPFGRQAFGMGWVCRAFG